jgi:adenine-specific DNA-methyltransferase
VRTAFTLALSNLDPYAGNPAWTDGHDVIGSAYERAIDGSHRRRLGQFFTPIRVGRVMARWLLESDPRVLLDPGCGSGSLLIAAEHERVGTTTFVGIDVDPLAIDMARRNADLRSMKRTDLQIADFFRYEPETPPDAIICNPPYTRHHAISSTKKDAIHRGFVSRLGIQFYRSSSLHVLFLVRALEISAPDARLAFVTPSTWLDKNYAAAVKQYLLEHAHVHSIVSMPANELIFDQALTTASITLIEKGDSKGRTTRMAQSPSSSAKDLRATFTANGAARVQLHSHDKWSQAASPLRKTGVALGELASVHRGIATGCNAFFVLSEVRRRELGISECSLRFCLPSPKAFRSSEITEDMLRGMPVSAKRWLLKPTRVRAEGPLASYLASGLVDFDVRSRTLVQQRENSGRKWYDIPTDVEAPIVVTYINQSSARFVRNRVAGIPLNNWLRIIPKDGVDSEALFKVLTQMSMQSEIRSRGRNYGQGMWKIEPSDMLSVRIPKSDLL